MDTKSIKREMGFSKRKKEQGSDNMKITPEMIIGPAIKDCKDCKTLTCTECKKISICDMCEFRVHLVLKDCVYCGKYICKYEKTCLNKHSNRCKNKII